MNVPGLLALLKAEPTLLPKADPTVGEVDIEQRRRSGAHNCLVCGCPAETATLAECDSVQRWIDLCMSHFVELRRAA